MPKNKKHDQEVSEEKSEVNYDPEGFDSSNTDPKLLGDHGGEE